jgi:hypothetical protein
MCVGADLCGREVHYFFNPPNHRNKATDYWGFFLHLLRERVHGRRTKQCPQVQHFKVQKYFHLIVYSHYSCRHKLTCLNALLSEVTRSPERIKISTDFWARLQSSIIILDAETEKPKIRKKSRRESEEEDVVQEVSAAGPAADFAAPSAAAFQDTFAANFGALASRTLSPSEFMNYDDC